MADAVQYASDLGSVVVMAADGGSSPEYPAAYALAMVCHRSCRQNGDLVFLIVLVILC